MEDRRRNPRDGSFAMEGQSPVSYLPSSIRPADREPFLHHFQTGSLAEPLKNATFSKTCTAPVPPAGHTPYATPQPRPEEDFNR